MSRVAEMQAGIRDLIKNRNTSAPQDPYLKQVAESPGFAMLQEIAIWWRAFQLSSYCVSTGKLLKRLGLFDEAVKAFFFQRAVSPYIETAGDSFLATLCTHENPLIAAMASFERAVLRAKKGDTNKYCVLWDRNPEQVFQALVSGQNIPVAEANASYRMTISRGIPSFVACVREAVGTESSLVHQVATDVYERQGSSRLR